MVSNSNPTASRGNRGAARVAIDFAGLSGASGSTSTIAGPLL